MSIAENSFQTHQTLSVNFPTHSNEKASFNVLTRKHEFFFFSIFVKAHTDCESILVCAMKFISACSISNHQHLKAERKMGENV